MDSCSGAAFSTHPKRRIQVLTVLMHLRSGTVDSGEGQRGALPCLMSSGYMASNASIRDKDLIVCHWHVFVRKYKALQDSKQLGTQHMPPKNNAFS